MKNKINLCTTKIKIKYKNYNRFLLKEIKLLSILNIFIIHFYILLL